MIPKHPYNTQTPCGKMSSFLQIKISFIKKKACFNKKQLLHDWSHERITRDDSICTIPNDSIYNVTFPSSDIQLIREHDEPLDQKKRYSRGDRSYVRPQYINQSSYMAKVLNTISGVITAKTNPPLGYPRPILLGVHLLSISYLFTKDNLIFLCRHWQPRHIHKSSTSQHPIKKKHFHHPSPQQRPSRCTSWIPFSSSVKITDIMR
jgi:hypothetical protein